MRYAEAEFTDDKRIVDALRGRGFKLSSIYDLVNSKQAYPEAIPVLVMHLSEVEDLAVKEGLVRALTVKEARGLAGPALVREFEKLPYEGAEIDRVQMLKWAIGNALSVVASDSEFSDVVELLRDRRHGKAREMLAIALGRLSDPRGSAVLQEMLEDEQVAGHAIMALGRLGAREARAQIEKFLDDKRSWVRREAKKALERIDKA